MLCKHELGKREWARMQNGVMKLHPLCRNCGTLKNISSDRGRGIGHFIIALSKLRKILAKRGYRISDAQIRLIAKELSEIDGFTDTWWVTFSKQKEIFIKVVQKYVRVTTEVVEAVF
jgi:hypothetical protein